MAKNLPYGRLFTKLPKNRSARFAGFLDFMLFSNEGGTLMVPPSNFPFLPDFFYDQTPAAKTAGVTYLSLFPSLKALPTFSPSLR